MYNNFKVKCWSRMMPPYLGRVEKYFKDTIKEDRSVALWRPYGDFLCESGGIWSVVSMLGSLFSFIVVCFLFCLCQKESSASAVKI